MTVTDRRLPWPGTVRWRVTLLAAFAVAVVLVATGALLVVLQRRVLIDQLDETLTAEAERVMSSASPADEAMFDLAADDEAVAQLVRVDGSTVIAASAGVAVDEPIAAALSGGEPVFATTADPHGESGAYRVVSRRFEVDGEGLVVHVAAPLDDVDETVRSLVSALAFIVPVVVAILAGLVWRLVGRTLRPVEQIRTEVAGIGLRELDRRVPQPPGRDEIARLASTMNEMLDRLDVANRQQQRFVADASHELRTPLARMRSEIEVAHLAAATAPTAADVLASLGEEVDDLQRLTDDLLVLARIDAGVPQGAGRPVDLDDVVFEEVRARATPGVVVDTRHVSAAQVQGQRDELRRVVSNLLDNAVRHAAGTVSLSLSESDGVVSFVVADDGPGIPPERRSDVFERFRRVDDARTSGRGGTGLGLAIARDLVERHGGTITLDPDHDRGARFVVTLPATS